MKLSVHLLYPRDEESVSRLRADLHSDITLTLGPDLPEPAGYHILVAGRPQRKDLTASPNLQALVVPWAGLPEETRQLLIEFPDLAVHNLHHNAPIVAEFAITLLLAAAKWIVPMDRALRSNDWTPRYQPSPVVLLNGKTALVLGYGAIGQRVARLCRGLGMEVVAVRRHAGAPLNDAAAEVSCAPLEALHRLLPRANALIICLPHTPETSGLIGAQELSLLPAGAILVNVGRGSIVDEAALCHALQDGTLYAAGLDVWYNRPADEAGRSHTPPSAYPFHELDNVVMSPHRAGWCTETQTMRMAHLAALLNAAARGEPMPNKVDVRAGY